MDLDDREVIVYVDLPDGGSPIRLPLDGGFRAEPFMAVTITL